MSSIPNEIVERVRSEANIVDVISDYVRLRRTGKNWTGLCPFHDDKRPSFAVEPVRGIYKCFSCGKGGNVFTFLTEKNGWTFPEAVRHLAAQLNIEIPEDHADREQYTENERLAAAIREAARFYFRTLRSDAGLPAQAYFKGRGFTDETILRFGLGYAPDEWEALLKRLTEQGFTNQELEKAGLILKREGRAGWYDRFRGRTMFPIFGATGRVVGFGARRMKEDPDQPKYINTPETPIYQKSRVLYGLFQAKDAIRRRGLALFVEGYADVISLHQAGVDTAIATCGTAMTPDHAELIARYTNRVVLIFDSDRAGEAATERGIDVLLRQGLDVSVMRLPNGEDPDTFVQKFGAKEFEGRVASSVSFLEFRARAMKNAGDFDAPERKADAIRHIVGAIALIPDTLKRELYVQKLAADYHLPETLLSQELARAVGTQTARRPRPIPAANPTPPLPESTPDAAAADRPPEPATSASSQLGAASVAPAPASPALRQPITQSELPPEEFGLLKVLVRGDQQLLEHVFAHIDPDDFTHHVTRELVGVILAHYVNQRSFVLDELLMEEMNPELRDLVTLLAIERETISTHWSRWDPELREPNYWKIARDCLVRIAKASERRQFQTIQEELLKLENDPTLQEEEREEKKMMYFQRIRELNDWHRNLSALQEG